MNKFLLFVFTVIIGSSSCTAPQYITYDIPTKRILDTYIGKAKRDIIRDFGPPNSKFPDEQGGMIYTYEVNSPADLGYYSTDKVEYEFDIESDIFSEEGEYSADFYFSNNNRVYHIKTDSPNVISKKYAGEKASLDTPGGYILLAAITATILAVLTILPAY